MGKREPRVDTYIATSAGFAQPILTYFRDVVHAACPDVVERIKWGAPTFERKKILCGMAAFKAHCRIGFWNLSQAARAGAGLDGGGITAWFPNVTSMKDLPSKPMLMRLVKEAAALDEQGVRPPRPTRPARTPPLPVPDDLMKALRKNRKALAVFDAWAPGHRKQYVQWITEATRKETRASRVTTAVGWIAEGKPRHWKYMRRPRHG